MKKLFLILMVLHAYESAHAQSPLDQLLTRAIATSPDAKLLELTKTQNSYQDKLQLAALKPSLSVTSNLPGYTRSINSITQPDGSLKFQTQSQAYSTLGINASQAIPISGGLLSLISGLNRIDLFDPTRTTAWSSNLFIFSYSQPLMQYNELRILKPNLLASQKLNTAQYTKNKRQFEQRIATLVLDYILATTQKENNMERIVEREKTITKTTNLVEAGKLLAEDLYLLKLELKRTEAQNISLDNRLASLAEQISYHMGAETSLSEIRSLTIGEWQRSVPTADSLLAIAQKDPMWLQTAQAVLLAQQNIDRQQQNSGLQASFDVSFGYNQQADQLDEIYKNPLDRQMGTLSVSVPILSGGRAKYNKLIAQNTYEIASLQKEIVAQTARQQVDNIIRQYEQIENDILLAQESLTIAQERYARYTNLFEAGKITVDQYLQAQNYANRIELELLSAQVNYWKLQYSIFF